MTQDLRMAVDELFDPPLAEMGARASESVSPILDTFVCLGVRADLSGRARGVELPWTSPFCEKQRTTFWPSTTTLLRGYAPEGCRR
ncbi:MAG: hypothetical protein ACLSVD_17405 [Eggerthellaceae bacterium]